jgi:hypothetical protein
MAGFSDDAHPRDAKGMFAAAGAAGKSAGKATEKAREASAGVATAAEHEAAAGTHMKAEKAHKKAAKEYEKAAATEKDPARRTDLMAAAQTHANAVTEHGKAASRHQDTGLAILSGRGNAGGLGAFAAKHAEPGKPVAQKAIAVSPPSGLGSWAKVNRLDTRMIADKAAHLSTLVRNMPKDVPEKAAAAPKASRAIQHDDVVGAINKLNAEGKHDGLVPVPKIREALAASHGASKESVDAALLKADREGHIKLPVTDAPRGILYSSGTRGGRDMREDAVKGSVSDPHAPGGKRDVYHNWAASNRDTPVAKGGAARPISHEDVVAAIRKVNAEGRHDNLVPLPKLREALKASHGVDRPAVDAAVIAAERASHVKLSVHDNPFGTGDHYGVKALNVAKEAIVTEQGRGEMRRKSYHYHVSAY